MENRDFRRWKNPNSGQRKCPVSPNPKGSPRSSALPRTNPPAAVDDDIFWHDPLLQHPHLGVLPTATEEPWRFSFEVANLLPVPVQDAVSIFLLDLIRFLLQLLKPGKHKKKKKKSEWFGLERIFNVPTKKSKCHHSLGKVHNPLDAKP